VKLWMAVAGALFFLLLAPAAVLAKNTGAGIYGIIDQITFEPNANAPDVVRISGIFVVPVSPSSGNYQLPQRGYLYLRIRPGMEQAIRNDWNELKRLAGTGQVIGFGEYWVPNPKDPSGNPHRSLEVTVHRQSDSAEPDAYPLPNRKGIIKHAEKNDIHFDKFAAELRQAAH
jgi:hypothetical protein